MTTIIQQLLSRAVNKVYPSFEEAGKILEAGKPLRIYFGIDPTSAELHLGHTVGLLFLRRLLSAGHKPIVLFGDFTARIGDPTDKEAARKQLTPEEVEENMKTYKEQIAKILPSEKIEWRLNSEWLEGITLQKFEEVKAHITAQQLIARDMFQKRLAAGKMIYANELDYPILQGYDSVALDADGEVGGNDQTFNMLMGRDLLKRMKGKEKIVIALKLLADPETGKKMSKTEGTLVSLNATATDMYGGVMAFSDGMIESGFELLTDVPMSMIEEVHNRLESEENPKKLKSELAYEITRMYHGAEAAEKAKSEFENVFSKKEVPENMPEHRGGFLTDVLVDSGLVESKNEVHRLLKQDAIKINNKTVNDDRLELQAGDVVKVGPRRFLRII